MPSKIRAEVIRGIQAVGYLTEIDATASSESSKLTVDNNLTHSMVFRWGGGGTGLILHLRISADRPTRIMEFGGLELAMEELAVDWYESEGCHIYQAFGRGGPDFPRDQVLNHRVGDRGLVHPGTPVEGLLLGRCWSPLPSSYCHGRPFPAILWILDGYGTVHKAKLSIYFDASFKVGIPRRSSRSSIFDSYDGPDYSRCENGPSIANEPSPEAPVPWATKVQEDSDARGRSARG